jgi:two-component system cell cycle sensor histidine kinase/response regulator CckA
MRSDEPLPPNRDSKDAARPSPDVAPLPDFDYRELLEALLTVPWEADPDALSFTYVGPQAEALLGFPLDKWYEKGFWSACIHPDDREAAVKLCTEETGRNRDHTFEYRMIDADGRVVWILDAVRVHHVGGKKVLRGLLMDITERKLVDAALRQSEARLNACVQYTPNVAIQWYDREGRVVFWNTASERMSGFTEAEALGKTLDQLIHTPEEARRFLGLLDAISRTGESVGPAEYHFRRRDGSDAVCLSTTFGIPSPSGEEWFVCMDVDITDRKRMEEQLRQAQKAESLGVLAGGVAHDFNNLLTSILGFASLAEMELEEGSGAMEAIRHITAAGHKAAELTQQLLAYAGKGKFLVQPVQLSWLVKEMSRLIHSGISKKARIRSHLPDELLLIEGDAIQLRQVVMSLVSNASESLQEREGDIEIRTGVTEIDESRPASLRAVPEAKPGTYVFVEVTDTGRGMDEETLARIFDPFFSTKFTGRGLGLAAALGIVRSHHGLMEVRSKPGGGSTFRALFPAVAQPMPPPPAPKVEVRNWKGSGTVLMVDDEAPIRALGRVGLQRASFQVDEADDGQAAIDAFRNNPNGYVAVLLDLILPRKDGTEVLQEIRLLNPTVPVILMSGYTEQEVQNLLKNGGVAAFLHKPFNSAKLIETLREILAPLDK